MVVVGWGQEGKKGWEPVLSLLRSPALRGGRARGGGGQRPRVAEGGRRPLDPELNPRAPGMHDRGITGKVRSKMEQQNGKSS